MEQKAVMKRESELYVIEKVSRSLIMEEVRRGDPHSKHQRRCLAQLEHRGSIWVSPHWSHLIEGLSG